MFHGFGNEVREQWSGDTTIRLDRECLAADPTVPDMTSLFVKAEA